MTVNGTKSWLVCEKSFNGKHSRISCRTRFLTIKKYLEKNPDASIEDIPRKQIKSRCAINFENWKEKVEELSSNPDGVKLKTEKIKKLKNTKHEKVRKPKQNAINKTKTEKLKFAVKEEIKQIETILPNKEKMQPVDEKLLQISENLQSIAENLQSIKNEERIIRKSQAIQKKISEKPYIPRLRMNGIKNYNFFKYAYNFNMKEHPCDNILINNEDFTIAMSALNPHIPLSIENYKFDTSIPQHVKLNIRNNPPQLSICEKLQRLPPNWSTAMGFRALCIHTATNSTTQPSEHFVDNTNDSITKFRERLRSVFYSTALLSRLNPDMVGIKMAETPKPKAVKRKRSIFVLRHWL